MIRLAQIRLYSDDPEKVARFYEALGHGIEGPIKPGDKPDDFPVYYIRGDGGPDIAIFSRRTPELSGIHPDHTLFFFQVESPGSAMNTLQQIGFFSEAEEPRSCCERINTTRDPDGRLIALDSFFLSRLAEAAREQ